MANHYLFGDRLASVGGREAPWFRLNGESHALTGEESAQEAFIKAGVDFHYERVAPVLPLPDGTVLQTGKKMAIVRSPARGDESWREIATVDKSFEVVQPADFAALLEPLTGRWKPIAVASIQGGAVILMVLSASSVDVAGDEVGRYVVASNGVNGSHGMRIMIEHQRLACTNMLEAAFSRSEFKVSLGHSAGVGERFGYFSEVMTKLELAAVDEEQVFEVMTRHRLNEVEIGRVLEVAYPDPKPNQAVTMGREAERKGIGMSSEAQTVYERAQHEFDLDVELAKGKREGARESLARFNDEKRAIADSAWSVLNAVSEASQVRWGRNTVATAESELFGERRNERMRAAREIMAVVAHDRLAR